MSASDPGSTSPLAQADRWHFSFAGLLLLLFGLFVLLYAVSQKKVTVLEEEVTVLASRLRAEKSKLPPPASSNPSAATQEDPSLVSANETLQTVILKHVEELQEKLGRPDREKWVEAEALPNGGMLLRVVAPDLYGAGNFRVSATQRALLDKLGEAIRETGRRIRIEADADGEDAEALLSRENDSSPARSSEGPPARESSASNTWDLSARRAAWVAQYWMKKYNFDPAKMEVLAYGRFRGGKRRLEVIISRKESE